MHGLDDTIRASRSGPEARRDLGDRGLRSDTRGYKTSRQRPSARVDVLYIRQARVVFVVVSHEVVSVGRACRSRGVCVRKFRRTISLLRTRIPAHVRTIT